MKKNKFWIILAVIVSCGVFRLLPHASNITPIGAMALVGGMYFRNRLVGLILPILTLYVGDLILNNTIYATSGAGFTWFSDYMLYVYGAFILTGVFGRYLTQKSSMTKIVGGTLIASVLFFLITNIGTWASTTLYPDTITGMGSALLAGLPFFRNTMLGNAIFIPLFVAFFEYYIEGKSLFNKDLAVETL